MGHVEHQVDHPHRVAPLVVVPGHDLKKVAVEADAGPRVEGAGVGVGDKVAGDNIVFGVAQDSLKNKIEI